MSLSSVLDPKCNVNRPFSDSRRNELAYWVMFEFQRDKSTRRVRFLLFVREYVCLRNCMINVC